MEEETTVVLERMVSRIPALMRAMTHLDNLGWQEIKRQFKICWGKSPNKYRLLNIMRKRAEKYSHGDLIGEVMLDDRYFNHSLDYILNGLESCYVEWLSMDTDGSDAKRVEQYVSMMRRITREIMNDSMW